MKISTFSSVALTTLLSVTIVQAQSQFWLKTPDVNVRVFDSVGVPLAGPDYFVELWGGASADQLAFTLSAYRKERVIIPFEGSGIFIDHDFDNGGYSTVFDVRPYEPASLQVRAWDARLGATYEDVVALGWGGYGESPIFTAIGTDPFEQFPFPGSLRGLQSFSLRPVVPEPSTWALLAGGSVVLCFRLCRRRTGSVHRSA